MWCPSGLNFGGMGNNRIGPAISKLEMHRIGQDSIGSGSTTPPINGRCTCDAWTPQTCTVVKKYAAYSRDAWTTKLGHKLGGHSRPKLNDFL